MRDKIHYEQDERVKRKNIGLREFAITFVVMVFLVGIQTGLLVLPAFNALNSIAQIIIIMSYWAIVAFLFSFLTNWQIRQNYDKPMRKLGSAAKKVAQGDFSVYVEPIHTADKYDYIDVMFMDFNTMVQELGSIETLKNDFVSNVSHEIKTPLAVIRNYTMALRNKKLPLETQEAYMDTIISATDNLTALVTNILKLNKLENQEIESVAEPYDVCDQLCQCALQFESLWEGKEITFQADIEDKATINADRNMLEIVWNNLLSNALKFTPPGGEVMLSQTSDDEVITVSVSDTGCGMDAETLKHIFDKFYQGDTSHSGEGNGLGLALAHRVIEKVGGTLSVASQPGKGSTFTVTIPIRL
ncbi:MAG: HAMP domain-containing histidine kinase [Clostridia bacterium]|jgi:signal transduction histidine kinase|nr:HAMP domain-containing histidine kinase [Clostridia bacterium]MCI2015220.1 HAMP domain-containing histidine kinase [Clostridia bacterium]